MTTMKRAILTGILLVALYALRGLTLATLAPAEAALAVGQVRDSVASYGATTWILRSNMAGAAFMLASLIVVVGLWARPVMAGGARLWAWLMVSALLALTGCGPARVLPLETVGPNETAFVIPLEGATGTQEKFESIEFLAKHKVLTKRIEIPVRERSIGRMWWDYEWIPTVRVIKVDRSLVTREWAQSAGKNVNAVAVESIDSIGFHVGVNLTTFITEEDAATYLYFHTSKPLADVVDQNVRGFIQDQLATAFGQLSLEESKRQKARIFAETEKETIAHFKKYGVTISNIGNAGGLEFDDPKIQAAINDTANAEMSIQVAMKEKLAQDERNKRIVASAQAEAEAAREFAKAQEAQVAKVRLEIERMKAEAQLTAAQRWNGNAPASVLPEGSGFMFGLDGKK